MSIYYILNATHLYWKKSNLFAAICPAATRSLPQWTNVWLFNYSGVVIALLCSYWTNEKAFIESVSWAILVYGNHILPRNCPLCASSVRPLPHALSFCRRTLHLCDRYPFRLLTKSVSAVSGQDFMVVKLLHFFCVCFWVFFLWFWFVFFVVVVVWLFVRCCFCFPFGLGQLLWHPFSFL